MANRKRPIILHCPVTAEERALIEQKMAINGYIIHTDTTDIKAFTTELSAIDRNINQTARRLNAVDPAYQADIEEIRERQTGRSACSLISRTILKRSRAPGLCIGRS